MGELNFDGRPNNTPVGYFSYFVEEVAARPLTEGQDRRSAVDELIGRLLR